MSREATGPHPIPDNGLSMPLGWSSARASSAPFVAIANANQVEVFGHGVPKP